MANSKTIQIKNQFNLSSGVIKIKSIAGDAHLTTSQIYLNNRLIRNGEGEVKVSASVQSGDEIFLIATINKPEGSSDYASLTVEMMDDLNSLGWNFSAYEPDYDEVLYEISITLL